MITILFAGGLGNQMFMYALGRHLSIKNNLPLKLDYLRYKNIKNPDWERSERIFSLNNFNVAGETATQEDIGKFDKYYKRDTIVNRFLAACYDFKYRKRLFFEKPYVNEPLEYRYDFDERMLEYKYVEAYFRGFWQSEKYFKDIREMLYGDFTLKGKQNKNYDDMLLEIARHNSISLVVRRGDYLTKENKKIFYECRPDFFEKGIKIISEKYTDLKIFVNSDDLDWVKKNIKLPFSTIYISQTDFTDYQKMMFMSACQHHVIANTTFAWWGAWLSRNHNKTVITSKKWLLDETDNKKYTNHIIPSSWLKI